MCCIIFFVVTVRAGTRLWELVEAINEHKLALLVLPSILNQTVGGAIATGKVYYIVVYKLILNLIFVGTHGTGFDFGSLSTFIIELEIVTGTGEVCLLSSK